MQYSYLWMAGALLVTACSGKYVPEQPENVAGTGGAGGSSVGGAGGASTGGSGGSTASSVLDSCLAYTEMTDGGHMDTVSQDCTMCFQGPKAQSCTSAMMAPADTSGPCGTSTDCVDGCQCDGGDCGSVLCNCLVQCISSRPPECASLWAKAFDCLTNACDSACP